MRVPPVAFVLGAVTSIQFGAALAATLFDDAGFTGVSFLRLGFAALVLLAVWRPKPSEYEPSDLRLAVLFGLALGLMNFTFYAALERIPLGIAVTLEFVGPLGVAIAASRRRLDALWVVLAAAGILLLTPLTGTDDLDGLGVALALFAGACWAAYILLAARAGQRFTGGRGLAIAMLVAGLLVTPPGIIDAGPALLDTELIALGFVIALMSSVVPYSLETEALRRMPKGVFGVLMSLEPAVAALAGFLVLSQDLSVRTAIAIVLVVVASAGATRSSPPPAEV